MDELGQHLTGLTQAIKNLQGGYTQLEECVQALSYLLLLLRDLYKHPSPHQGPSLLLQL